MAAKSRMEGVGIGMEAERRGHRSTSWALMRPRGLGLADVLLLSMPSPWQRRTGQPLLDLRRAGVS